MQGIPYIPESAPFTVEQRAWLNGFLAGLFAYVPQNSAALSGDAQPKTGEPLLIMFGSQTGSAEGLAKKFAKECQARGFAPSVLPLNDYDKAALPQAKRLIVISSTWGDGEPPDNAANFWSWLNAADAPRLEQLEYAVLGLGDRNYADFCGASKKFDARLEQLGAKRLVSRGECDVDYESAAKSWMDGLWPKLTTNGAPSVHANGANGKLNGTTRQSEPAAYGKSNPWAARLLKNKLLNRGNSAKEVRHYELSLLGSGLEYEAGDALGIYPLNCPDLVREILTANRCTGDESIALNGENTTLGDALSRSFDITKPSLDLLAAVARSNPDCELAPLLEPSQAAALKKWLWGRDALDVLRLLRHPLPPAEFATLLRKLSPRLYSISSSPKAHPGEVHLTVSAVRYETFGRRRKGVASCFLADRCDTALKVYVQPSPGFKLPPKSETPVIMVGPGTGIAPFRAFLEERRAIGATGRNWLFFGDQKRECDFLYEAQITGWERDGHLTRLDLAFSRDQAEKLYVQHRMLENAPELWAWLEDGAHFYVCGDASRMAADVDAALHRIAETVGGKRGEEAKAYVSRLKSEKRYQRDVY